MKMYQNPHNWENNILLFIRLKFIYFKIYFSRSGLLLKLSSAYRFYLKKNQFQIGQRIRMSEVQQVRSTSYIQSICCWK